MNIICDHNPDELIDEIGDRNFMICDGAVDTSLRGPYFPNEIRIIDCEDGVTIKICTDYGFEETLKAAKALLNLLNQEYLEK